MDPIPDRSGPEARYLRWIAYYNFGKGVLLCFLAIGILGFLHKDVDTIVGNWMSLLGFNMENRHIVAFLARLDRVTDRQLAQWSGITFALSSVFIAEGAGLLLRQEWAKYLTVVFTSSFIPIEVRELFQHFGFLKLALLFANLGIVAFLITALVKEKKQRALAGPHALPATTPASAGCESA